MLAQGTYCPFTFIVKMSEKMTEIKIAQKVSKINLRIISKSHAYLQSMVKTSVKFQKNLNITVGGYRGTEGRKDRRSDGMTESQKPCPSAFLRKGGGQKGLYVRMVICTDETTFHGQAQT